MRYTRHPRLETSSRRGEKAVEVAGSGVSCTPQWVGGEGGSGLWWWLLLLLYLSTVYRGGRREEGRERQQSAVSVVRGRAAC